MTTNKKGASLESAGSLGTPSKNQDQNTISLTEEQELFRERESRTIEAEAMMALVRRIIEPDGAISGEHENRDWLNQIERYGLSYVCDIIAKNMAENAAAICDCYERKHKGKVS
ncbi:MAG: hypothetical protein K0B09_14985 [Bacteroidales bacterium]|nr:hypothetical protein [Bacteroidales bacterium]